MNINIENVTKSYDNVEVLKQLNIQIQGKKAIGIIGESGCGKSTLLRQLAGIESVDEGSISINGQSPNVDKKNFQSKIGYVFQKHNLFPHLSVRNNILLILNKIRKMDVKLAEEKVQSVLNMLKLENEANKKPNQISGGQAQRASIARALASDPELIFLDEPTAALDPILTHEVLKSVKELKKTGIEFIFITHEIDFLKEFADYVIFMKDGHIVEHGDITLLQQPKSAFLHEFLNVKQL